MRGSENSRFFGRSVINIIVIWLPAGARLNVTSYCLDQLMRSYRLRQMCFMVMCPRRFKTSRRRSNLNDNTVVECGNYGAG